MGVRLTRRDFLKQVAVSAPILSCLGCVSKKSVTKDVKQPNIIFLLTDDQRADALGCAGHPVIKTPHIDWLAENGVRFSNAFVAEPVCSPSRATFLTGQYERTHRVGFSSVHQMNDQQWEDTYPAILKKAGYYTGFIGKFGLENYTFRPHPEEKFDFWFGHDGWASFFPKGLEHCSLYQDSEETIITSIMADGMERFLDSVPNDQSFCLSVSFSAPHNSTATTMYPNLEDYAKMRLPANELPEIRNHPVYGDLYRDQEISFSPDTGTNPYKHIPHDVHDQILRKELYSYNYEKETCREHHIRYDQLVTGVDNAVGKLISKLKDKNALENTMIIFSSDHGLLMGEYGMGGKALLYDTAAKIPLIVYDPRLIDSKKGQVIDRFVISTDIAPTIVSAAGVNPPETMQGKDLNMLIDNPTSRWRDEIFLESLYVGRLNPFIECVRTEQFKYLRYFQSPPITDKAVNKHYGRYPDQIIDFNDQTPVFEQLFDLKSDPDEKVNLINDSRYQNMLEVLRKRCKNYSAKLTRDSAAYWEK